MSDLKDLKSLDQRISELERQVADEKKAIKDQFYALKERMRPGNIIKDAFKEISESGELKNNFINYAITIAAGALSRKLMVGGHTKNPLKNILGSVVQFGVSSLVSKKADTIKNVGASLLNNIIMSFKNRKRRHDDEEEEEKEAYEYNMF